MEPEVNGENCLKLNNVPINPSRFVSTQDFGEKPGGFESMNPVWLALSWQRVLEVSRKLTLEM